MEDMRLSQQDVERLEHEPTKEQPAAPSPIFEASANSLQPKTIAKSPKREMPTWAWAALLLGGALVLAGILYYIGRHNMQVRTNTANTQDEKLIAAVTKDYFSISGAKVDPTEAAAEKLALPNKLTIDNTQGNGKLDCEESVGYENGTIPHEGVVCERSYAVDYGFNGA